MEAWLHTMPGTIPNPFTLLYNKGYAKDPYLLFHVVVPQYSYTGVGMFSGQDKADVGRGAGALPQSRVRRHLEIVRVSWLVVY